MKIINDIALTELGEEYIAVPVGETAENFRGVVKLNKTGKIIWDYLADGLSQNEIADRILERYEDVEKETLTKVINEIVEKLNQAGLLVE